MRRTTMGSPDVACSSSNALARGSLTTNPAISARQTAMNPKNFCMNCTIAAFPRPIQLEPTTRRVILPSPTITPRRIHAKVILRIEPSDNKADSPHACSQSASDDRSGGKRVSRTGRITSNPRTTDGTQREIRLDAEPTRKTTCLDPCWSHDLLPVRDLGPRSTGRRWLSAAGQSARQLVGRGTARHGRAPRGPTDRQVRDPGHLHLREGLA